MGLRSLWHCHLHGACAAERSPRLRNFAFVNRFLLHSMKQTLLLAFPANRVSVKFSWAVIEESLALDYQIIIDFQTVLKSMWFGT